MADSGFLGTVGQDDIRPPPKKKKTSTDGIAVALE